MEKIHLEKKDYPLVLTVGDVQEILGISQSKVYQVVNSKGFPLIKSVGRAKRIPRDKFFEWMEGEG